MACVNSFWFALLRPIRVFGLALLLEKGHIFAAVQKQCIKPCKFVCEKRISWMQLTVKNWIELVPGPNPFPCSDASFDICIVGVIQDDLNPLPFPPTGVGSIPILPRARDMIRETYHHPLHCTDQSLEESQIHDALASSRERFAISGWLVDCCRALR